MTCHQIHPAHFRNQEPMAESFKNSLYSYSRTEKCFELSFHNAGITISLNLCLIELRGHVMPELKTLGLVVGVLWVFMSGWGVGSIVDGQFPKTVIPLAAGLAIAGFLLIVHATKKQG